jgi:CRP/FNR family transcriptional regulator, cyclic AMP receptor protein
MNRSEILRTLGSCELFKGLEKGNIEKLASLCEEKTYETGEYIFRQGDYGEYVYVIAEGHIFLERAMPLGPRKGNLFIGVLGKERVLGCWSTLLGESHNHMSSASCQKPTIVLAIRGSELRDMMLSNLEFGFTVLEKLCLSLRDRMAVAYGAMEKI